MADFMSAVRKSTQRLADTQRRKSRLSGRPLTGAEASAPYEAMAATAGDRLARMKELEQRGRGIDVEESLGEQRLEQQAEETKTRADLERERLAEMRRDSEARIAEMRADRKAQMSAAEMARERDRASQSMQGMVLGGAGGAKLGADVLGETIGKGWGGALGGIVGAGVGKILGGGCMIVSACEGRDSYEVEVARAFRDTLLDVKSLLGYYALAFVVAPLMGRFSVFRRVIKVCLVNHLIDYGEWVLGAKPMRERAGSKIISRVFLRLIRALGA